MAALTQRYQDGEEIDYLLEMKHLQRKYGDGAAVHESLLEWESGSVDEILAATDEIFVPRSAVVLNWACSSNSLAASEVYAAGTASQWLPRRSLWTLVKLVCLLLLLWILLSRTDYADAAAAGSVRGPPDSLAATRTVPRVYQAALHWTLAEIKDRHSKQEFVPAYLKKVGRADRIRVKAAHSLTMAQISTLMEEMHPAVIIIDMVANIRGGHQNLEARWQELRILGCEVRNIIPNDCAIIGTMQLSLEGYNMLYPPLTAI